MGEVVVVALGVIRFRVDELEVAVLVVVTRVEEVEEEEEEEATEEGTVRLC